MIRILCAAAVLAAGGCAATPDEAPPEPALIGFSELAREIRVGYEAEDRNRLASPERTASGAERR